MKLKHLLIGALAAASFNTMQGATVLHLLDETLSTGATPSGSAPWLTVTATDTVRFDPNTGIPTSAVRITLESNLQSPTEFFDKVGFVWGIDPQSVPAFSMITEFGGDVSGSVSIDPFNSINTGVGTSVGLLVDFVNSNAQGGALRFNGTDTFEFTIVEEFGWAEYDATTIFDNVGVIAHVNGIGGDSSAWVSSNIPEPSTALLGLISLAGLARRKR